MLKDFEKLVKLASWSAQNLHPIFKVLIDYIEVHHGEHTLDNCEDLQQRKKFHDFVDNIGMVTYTDKEQLLIVLDIFDRIHIDCFELIEKKANISPRRHLSIRKSILLNLGLTVLLKHLRIEHEMIEHDSNFEILKQKSGWKLPKFDMKAYEDELRDLYDSLEFGRDNDEFRDTHPEYVAMDESDRLKCVSYLLDITKDKKKKVVSLDAVEEVMLELELDKFSKTSREYMDHIQDKIFRKVKMTLSDIPEGREVVEEAIELLKEPEWSDEVARSSGPYSSRQSMGQPSISAVRHTISAKRPSSSSTSSSPAKRLSSSSAFHPRAAAAVPRSPERQSHPTYHDHEKDTHNRQRDEVVSPVRNLNQVAKSFREKNDKLDPLHGIDKDRRRLSDDEEVSPLRAAAAAVRGKKRNHKNSKDFEEDDDILNGSDVDVELDTVRSKRSKSNRARAFNTPTVSRSDKVPFDAPGDEINDFDGDVSVGAPARILTAMSRNVPAATIFPESLTTRPARLSTSSSGRKGKSRLPADDSIRPKRVAWSFEEEEALRAGIQRYGISSWAIILQDPDFSVLENRTNVDLKDKYRTMQRQGQKFDNK